MFQNAKNRKGQQHVADTIQTLVEMGIKPQSIHFGERKVKVIIDKAPTTQGLGVSYCYSWGKDQQGNFYEMHMLPMRDINLVWTVYPRRQAIRKPAEHTLENSGIDSTQNHGSTLSKRLHTIKRVKKSLRLNAADNDDIMFGVAA